MKVWPGYRRHRLKLCRYFYRIFMFLGDLILRYGISLSYLSQSLDGKSEAAIALIVQKIGMEFGLISPESFLRAGS